MNLAAFIIGISITTLIGWLSVGLIQGSHSVLSRGERVAYGVVLGPTLSMFFVFISHIAGFTKLDLAGFLVPQILLLVVLFLMTWLSGGLTKNLHTEPFAEKKTYPKFIQIGVVILCAWTALKIVAGAYDLVSVPTYWDDSFNNWNLRGKIFYVTEKLTLEIPSGSDMTGSSEGVGSYPPMLPMMKTWLSVLRGTWSEPLVNSVHLVWFLGLLQVFYFTLRRYTDPLLSAIGVCVFISLPLVIIHGSNPYADMFVSAHVLIAVSLLLRLQNRDSIKELFTTARLFLFSLGLLALTKNEALVLFVPLLLIIAVVSEVRKKNAAWSLSYTKNMAIGFIILLFLTLPWVFFKWKHGLTFGNAKSISSFSLSLNSGVIKAIWIHLTHEANWLLLPLILPLSLMAAGKSFWKTSEAVLGLFVLSALVIQSSIFLFVPSLALEAINQTGLSRGLLHIAPEMILLVFLAVRYPLTEKTV